MTHTYTHTHNKQHNAELFYVVAAAAAAVITVQKTHFVSYPFSMNTTHIASANR